MTKKIILVTGATGRQGQALIHALDLNSESNQFHVLALTRTISSPTASALAAQYPEHLSVIQCNLDSAQEVRKVFEDAKKEYGAIFGVFCVLAFPGLGANADGEERQGMTLADISAEFGVSSFIFSSVERGGEYNDDNAVLDRRAKVMIERHIKALGESKNFPWTILRPGFFMENYEGMIGAISVAVLKTGLKPTTRNQMVAVDDIGHVAAAVFRNPRPNNRQILVIAGEYSTILEQDASFKRATGNPLPSTPFPTLFASILIYLNGHTQGLITDVERIHSARTQLDLCPEVAAQTAAAKALYPGMRTLEDWARNRARRGGENDKRSAGWNEVSIWKLLTGRV
ncbi:NAD-binding protein [Favolaschia claudopus]|uniref:NAD-binding protein n=1 Tax=Favolaschia claudopus TaxID=2862362 RepID=A0AAW0A3A2_9AGAR